METIIFLLIVLVALVIAAKHWGFDSRDSADNAEWQRRRDWQDFH